MEEKKKGGKGFLIFLGILIVLLLGYLVYSNETGKTISSLVNKNEKNAKVTTTTTKVVTEEETYKNFINFYKENRQVVYGNNNFNRDFGQVFNINAFAIDKDGNLTLTLKNELSTKYGKTYIIDTNVFTAGFFEFGNAGYINLYYIKEDGSIKYLDTSKANNNELVTKNDEKKAKYIVSMTNCIVESSGFDVCAIDINGKTFEIK